MAPGRKFLSAADQILISSVAAWVLPSGSLPRGPSTLLPSLHSPYHTVAFCLPGAWSPFTRLRAAERQGQCLMPPGAPGS